MILTYGQPAGFKPHPRQAYEWQDIDIPACYGVHDGDDLLAIGDVIEFWTGRYCLWFFAGENIKPNHWVPMLKLFKKELMRRTEIRRLEISVDPCYTEAVRLAEMLGFEFECEAKSYYPDGREAYLYAWVRQNGWN